MLDGALNPDSQTARGFRSRWLDGVTSPKALSRLVCPSHYLPTAHVSSEAMTWLASCLASAPAGTMATPCVSVRISDLLPLSTELAMLLS